MKKLLVMLALALGLNASASHIMGGMIGVFQTSQDSTTVGVWLVTDGGGLPAPQSITVEKWEMNSVGWYVQNGTVTLTQGTTPISFQGQTLVNYASEYLDLDSNKYRFIYTNCCLANNLYNNLTFTSGLINPSILLSADYWHIPNNSTPYARVPFIINQQVNTRNTMKPVWGWNSFLENPDPWDIVEITHEALRSCYANGTFIPIQGCSLSGAVTYNQPLITVSNDSISWNPTSIGSYIVEFEIADYRNGDKIGVQRIQWTFKVVNSTVGIEENIADYNTQYEVYDWYGRYMGSNIDWAELKGLYVIRYSNGKVEKVFCN